MVAMINKEEKKKIPELQNVIISISPRGITIRQGEWVAELLYRVYNSSWNKSHRNSPWTFVKCIKNIESFIETRTDLYYLNY